MLRRAREEAPDARRAMGASFWRLFASSTGSNLSDGLMQAAIPLLAASLTRDPVLVSLVASLQYLPWLLFSIPAGALVDRVDRRRAMLGANVARAVLLFALAALLVADAASIWVVYVVAFSLGAAETVYDNAARAMLPAVVDTGRLERGNSLLSTAEAVTNLFLGAPLGAWLFTVAAVAPLGVSSVLFLGAGVLVLTVRGRFRPEREASTGMGADIREGMSWLVHHPILSRLVVASGLGSFANALATGIGVLFVLEELGLDASWYGVLLAAGGVGAIVGSLLSPTLGRLLGRAGSLGFTGALNGVALAVMGWWPTPAVAFVGFGVSSLAIGAFNVQVMSVRQALIPDALFGRVQGAYRTVLWGSIPLGSLAGGALALVLGLAPVFVIAGALAVVSGVAVWVVLASHRDAVDAAFRTRAT